MRFRRPKPPEIWSDLPLQIHTQTISNAIMLIMFPRATYGGRALVNQVPRSPDQLIRFGPTQAGAGAGAALFCMRKREPEAAKGHQ